MKKNRKRRTADVLWTFCTLVLTAWLFFDFSRISVLLVFYLPAALYQKEKESQRKKKWEMNLAFKDALVCMENSLAIGYSPESSIREAGKNLEQLHGWEHEICREFGRMVKQMELGNSVEEVFSEFGDRSGIEDIHQLADIFSVVKRTGGNLSMVLRFFIKNFSAQVLKANMRIVGATEHALVLYRDKLPKFNNGGEMIFNWFMWQKDIRKYPKIHPTQKPIILLKRLIEIFTDKGDVVIDPVAGSGSTLRAAMELERNSYGFEVDKKFAKMAQEEMLNVDFVEGEGLF